LSYCGSGTDNAIADWDAPIFNNLSTVPDREPDVQVSRVFLRQQNGENFIVNQAPDLLCGTGEYLIEVQRGVDLLAEFREDGEGLCRNILHRIFVDRVHLIRLSALYRNCANAKDARQRAFLSASAGATQVIITGVTLKFRRAIS